MNEVGKNIENYSKYLEFLQGRLNKFFEAQSPYIACKKGCALCCKNAQFPYSEVEFSYLIQGSLSLPKEIQEKVDKNIQKVLKEKESVQGANFKYDCPFLIDNECSIYLYRGIVCRTFGLIEVNNEGNDKIPFCHEKGLNYSLVVDEEKMLISEEKYLALNEEKQPLAYNISYKFLTSEKMEKEFCFNFGDKKPLIDWFSE